MALLKTLTVTGSPTDGAIVTNLNTNTSPSIGTGASMQFQSSKAMGRTFGIEMIQTTTGQVFFYFDPDSAVSGVFTMLVPFRFEAAPLVTGTILRFYPDTAHVTNLCSMGLTSSRRLQILENNALGGTPLNVTSDSGSPLAAATDYILQVKVDLTGNTMEVEPFAYGSATEVFTLGGALAADLAAAASIGGTRFGIGTASTALDLSTNDGFAIGDTDYLSRYDLLGPPTLVVDRPADNLVDLRASSGTGGLTFPTPTHVSGATVTVTSLDNGLWLFEQDAAADAVYNVKVVQADDQETGQNETIVKLSSVNQNAPLIPSGSTPGTTWE